MARNPRNAAGGGFLILLAALLGTGIGLHYHEVTPGFLIGLSVGAALAVLLWAVDRRR